MQYGYLASDKKDQCRNKKTLKIPITFLFGTPCIIQKYTSNTTIQDTQIIQKENFIQISTIENKQIWICFFKIGPLFHSVWYVDLYYTLGPIGSAVLTFIGYKQTDKQSKYID